MVPDLVAYTAFISSCDQGRQPFCALKLFKATRLQGMVLGAITYNSSASACEE